MKRAPWLLGYLLVSGWAQAAAQNIPADVEPPLAGIEQALLLRLNLPSFRLELYRGAEVLRQYRVAIGDTAYPTPIGRFDVSRVDWDPWWVPPASPWAKGDTLTPPGPTNPMGRVRLWFEEMYFIHGTPQPGSVGSATSHGCVRLANSDAVDLAKRVMAYGAPNSPTSQVDSLAARVGKTRVFPLLRTVPLEIRYEVAEIEEGKLTLYGDVYRRFSTDALLATVLSKAQRALGDSLTIDTARVGEMILRPVRRPYSVDLRTLLQSRKP